MASKQDDAIQKKSLQDVTLSGNINSTNNNSRGDRNAKISDCKTTTASVIAEGGLDDCRKSACKQIRFKTYLGSPGPNVKASYNLTPSDVTDKKRSRQHHSCSLQITRPHIRRNIKKAYSVGSILPRASVQKSHSSSYKGSSAKGDRTKLQKWNVSSQTGNSTSKKTKDKYFDAKQATQLVSSSNNDSSTQGPQISVLSSSDAVEKVATKRQDSVDRNDSFQSHIQDEIFNDGYNSEPVSPRDTPPFTSTLQPSTSDPQPSMSEPPTSKSQSLMLETNLTSSPSEPKHSTSAFQQPTSQPQNTTSESRHSTSEPKHPTSEPKHPTSESQNSTSESQQLTSESRKLTSELRQPTSVSQQPLVKQRLSLSEIQTSKTEQLSSIPEPQPFTSTSCTRPKDRSNNNFSKESSQDSEGKTCFWQRSSKDLNDNTENTPEDIQRVSQSRKSSDVSSFIKVCSSRRSIIDLDVDVIVSSDNSKLQSGGMVARLISERGGRSFHICKQSVLSMCQNIKSWSFQPTPATGDLKCKHVFHVVVPQFSDQHQSHWVDKLKSLTKDILRRTEILGYKSIALPIIGSGRNSAPQAFIIDLICDAIKEYMSCRPGYSCLETIIMVHPEKQVEKYIEKQIRELDFTPSVKRQTPPKEKGIKTHFLDVRDRKNDTCPICMEETKKSKLKQLSKCNHIFCKNCLDECFKRTPACPICSMVYGAMKGNQPYGIMVEIFIKDSHLPGYKECGIIQVFYYFPDGIQGKEHPKPGLAYSGTKRAAFLPDNEEGQKVHRLFRRAFNQRVMFTIGTSRTTGKEDVITWNDIHHKTNVKGGPEKFGYPDPTYLSRVLEELAAKGITED